MQEGESFKAREQGGSADRHGGRIRHWERTKRRTAMASSERRPHDKLARKPERHIVPFGGLQPAPGRTHPIVEYLLELTGKSRSRVAFIPTATGDSSEALVNMYNRFPPDRCERSQDR